MTHSIYSFSSSHRWIEGHCPASIRMSKGYPNLSNPAAELGTAVHELGEFAIALGVNLDHCIDLEFNGFKVNTKMVEDARLYRNVIEDLSLRYGVKPLLEQRVTLKLDGRDDVFGTSDSTHLALNQRLLHTTDYKNGYGLVEVTDNSQTAGYSVATLDTFDLWGKVDTVANTIVQPNYDHVEGPVRTVIYTMDEMREWKEKFRRSVSLADDRTQKPNAGEWCHYCPAQANCRPRMEYTLQKAYTDSPIENISIGELEAFYVEIGSIKKFLEKVEERMLDEARNGVTFKDFKLVKSYSRANCENVDGLLAEAKSRGVDPIQLYLDPRLVGKTRAAELLPKEIVDQFYRTPPPSTTLVPMSNNRPAIRVGKATGVFAPIVTQPTPSASGVFGVIE